MFWKPLPLRPDVTRVCSISVSILVRRFLFSVSLAGSPGLSTLFLLLHNSPGISFQLFFFFFAFFLHLLTQQPFLPFPLFLLLSSFLLSPALRREGSRFRRGRAPSPGAPGPTSHTGAVLLAARTRPSGRGRCLLPPLCQQPHPCPHGAPGPSPAQGLPVTAAITSPVASCSGLGKSICKV